MSSRWLAAAGLLVTSMATMAQVPYLFGYNPGPTKGTQWMAQSSDGQDESSAGVVTSAPHPVWARICYSIGPSDSSVSVYSQTHKDEVRQSEVAWGGCTDVFGTSIWIGNPHTQRVGGYYGIAPATPAR